MRITPELFSAFLLCPTKCWLKLTGEHGTGNAYAEWVETQNESYRAIGIDRLRSARPSGECVISAPWDELKQGTWRLAFDVLAQTEKLESHIHALERFPCEGRGKAAQFVPIRFIYRNKLTRNDRFLIAFDTLVLSKVVGREVEIANIIHGDDRAVANVNTSSLWGQVQDVQRKLTTLVSAASPPDLILIRHCAECEFHAQCRQRALEKDELSLLGSIKEGDRKKLHSKGIFTLNQLSYTFRPRRRPKKSTPLAPQHYFPLQALAIRNNAVYLNGKPDLPRAETSVFLDVEGLSSAGPFYLVGALVLKSGQEQFHSFWADRPSEQANIFAQFVELVSSLPQFWIYHFGRYDTAALRIVRNRLPQELQPKLDLIMQRTTNVLSLVYSHVYFPTYSNGLKDLGRFLGCRWTTECSSGLSSIVARKSWEADQNAQTKAALIQYNKEDCMALKRLSVHDRPYESTSG